MEDDNKYISIITNTLSYTAINVGIENLTKKNNKIGLPIFFAGQIAYIPFQNKKITKGQEYYFAILWQMLFSSLYYENMTPTFLDALNTFGAIFVGKTINDYII